MSMYETSEAERANRWERAAYARKMMDERAKAEREAKEAKRKRS